MRKNKDDIKLVFKTLNERKKELDCIYRIDELLKDFDSDLHNILTGICEFAPIGWQYSEICKVKIIVNGFAVESTGFKETELKLSANLEVDGEKVGEFIICYIKSVKSEKGVFLPEETRLFKTIVEKINQYLSFRKLKEFYANTIENKNKLYGKDISFTDYLKSLKLSNEDIEIITKVEVDFKKGETVCKQGTFASFIMLIKSGMVKSFIENSHYKSHIFKFTGAFNIIGLSTLYGDSYYHFSCKALVPSKFYLVERSEFDKIVRKNPDFAIEIMKIYSKSLQTVYDKLGSIANKQSIGKVCISLLYLAENVFKSNIIDTSVTRKDIAEFSGLATENLVRILSELKKDNIIAINNRVIEILNFETLKMLSNIG